MAEETRDARTAAPRGIIATVLCCGVFGLVYILGMLFATPDITALEVPVQVAPPGSPPTPRTS
jgi:amino acid transporter